MRDAAPAARQRRVSALPHGDVMTSSTRTRSNTVDRILTLIDDCLADVDPTRQPSAAPPAVLRPARWTASAYDGDRAA